MTTAFAMDVGGTAIKLGIVAADGAVVARDRLLFDHAWSFETLIDTVVAAYERLCGGATRADAIGIATPGYSEPVTGDLIDGAGNVPVLKGRSMREALSRRLGLPAVVDNDGISAARGEMLFGAGRNYERFALMTIGTGIGGAVVVGGTPLAAPNGAPPELGAIVVGPVPTEGRPVDLEHRASARALLASYNGMASSPAVRVEDIFAAARAGDPVATAAVEATCRYVAQAFGGLVNAIGLDACILGGGVSGAGEILRAGVERHLRDFTWPYLVAGVRVELAALGNDAGLLGVAALALGQTRASILDAELMSGVLP